MTTFAKIRQLFWSYPASIGRLAQNAQPFTNVFVALAVGALFSYIFVRNEPVFESLAQNSRPVVEATVGELTFTYPTVNFENPADRDIYEILFDRFIYTDQNGTPLPGIAKTWSVSSDAKVYEFRIDEDLRWQDGEPLDVNDIVFSFVNYWDISQTNRAGEIKVEAIDSYSVKFTLQDANSTFFESVSIYIVPQHIVAYLNKEELVNGSIDLDFVGLGDFKLIRKAPRKIDFQSISNPSFEFEYRTYINAEELGLAFKNNEIDYISNVPSSEMPYLGEYEPYSVVKLPIKARRKILFMNVTKMANREIRQAISFALNKDELIAKSGIDATPIDLPYDADSWAYNQDAEKYKYNAARSSELLKSVGYTSTDAEGYVVHTNGTGLEFTLTFFDSDINTSFIRELQAQLKAVGIRLNLNPKGALSLRNETLATRDYEMLLFEIENSLDPDQYDIWHSTNKLYPQLNFSQYEFERVDIALERGRQELNVNKRAESYRLFQRYLMIDAPAVFLYHPQFVFATNNKIEGYQLTDVVYPEQRFRDMNTWRLSR